MKLSKAATFVVLSTAMFFGTVAAAHADDEPTPTLYSSEACADGSVATADDSGVTTCSGDVAITETSASLCADGSDPVTDMDGKSVCADGTDLTVAPVMTYEMAPGAVRRTLGAENPTATCVDGSDPVTDVSGKSVCADGTDLTAYTTTDVCSDTNTDASCVAPTGCKTVDSTTDAPCLIAYDTMSGAVEKSATVSTNNGSNVALPLLGILGALAIFYGYRRLVK